MCYKYEEGNRSLLDTKRLETEVERLVGLLGRKPIDVLNFGLETPALEQDDQFLPRLADNIRHLKQAGLIRFASCDSIDSGESYYQRMMRTGCFDLIWLHFGPLWPFPAQKLFPLAAELGMGVVTREAFTKGHLFRHAEVAGLPATRAQIAAASIRWILSHKEISTMVLGVRNETELESNLAAAATPPTKQDEEILRQLQTQPQFIAALAENEARFRK